MTASAEDGDEVYETAANGLKGWTDCFPKCRYAGLFSGGGLNDGAEAERKADGLEGAYAFGKGL